MKEVNVAATARTDTGKGAARQARRDGHIPAVLYGPEVEPQPLSVNAREFFHALKGASASTLIDLDVGGKKSKVLIRDLQRDPLSSEVVHIDFHAVSMSKPINISVPIHFIGTPIGVRSDGGIMQTTMREIEISCLPSDIPEHIEINVEELAIGESIHVRDITVDKAEILSEEQRTIVVISAPTVIKSTTAEGEEGEEGAEGEAAEGAEGAEGEGAEGEEKKED
jgi:large subunit ribosomal protein L25